MPNRVTSYPRTWARFAGELEETVVTAVMVPAVAVAAAVTGSWAPNRPLVVGGGATAAVGQGLPREPRPTTIDSSPLQPAIAVGGRLQHFAAEWEKVTEVRWGLAVTRQGFRITFTAPLPRRCRVKITSIPKEADKREVLLQAVLLQVCKVVLRLGPLSKVRKSLLFYPLKT